MWRKKKVIAAALAAVLLVGGIGGAVAAAAAGEEDGPQAAHDALLARVAEKIGIDEDTLAQAFAEAQEELRDEFLSAQLQRLVDEGELTQDEADQLSEWWQGRPDVLPAFGEGGRGGFRGHRGGHRLGGFGGFGDCGKMAPPAQ
jgi:hypothetical protein